MINVKHGILYSGVGTGGGGGGGGGGDRGASGPPIFRLAT